MKGRKTFDVTVAVPSLTDFVLFFPQGQDTEGRRQDCETGGGRLSEQRLLVVVQGRKAEERKVFVLVNSHEALLNYVQF